MPAHSVRVADEVWIAAALLQLENPDREGFDVGEIEDRARGENLTRSPSLRPGVRSHVVHHCVATNPPSPNRYRMLVETGHGRRRLFLPTDRCHPGRRTGKSAPLRHQIPVAYRQLLDWYDRLCGVEPSSGYDPILSLRGMGKELWRDEDPDDNVKRLREERI